MPFNRMRALWLLALLALSAVHTWSEPSAKAADEGALSLRGGTWGLTRNKDTSLSNKPPRPPPEQPQAPCRPFDVTPNRIDNLSGVAAQRLVKAWAWAARSVTHDPCPDHGRHLTSHRNRANAGIGSQLKRFWNHSGAHTSQLMNACDYAALGKAWVSCSVVKIPSLCLFCDSRVVDFKLEERAPKCSPPNPPLHKQELVSGKKANHRSKTAAENLLFFCRTSGSRSSRSSGGAHGQAAPARLVKTGLAGVAQSCTRPSSHLHGGSNHQASASNRADGQVEAIPLRSGPRESPRSRKGKLRNNSASVVRHWIARFIIRLSLINPRTSGALSALFHVAHHQVDRDFCDASQIANFQGSFL
ncbi:hypothetical protein B0J15DRAFT_557607 [Fusarium solani]|uniref:SCP domain-containing protein n=1 Tax=Fusarium solani TaxID=169388 RepID=A0A9P9RE72_FUSSL|nr:uncharacterized protein B0J15DRAFT_557607 [Fusarium solani]KAH7275544.1 hypothetical protein B0J15DRAFT_557607 [Fusarium solani]